MTHDYRDVLLKAASIVEEGWCQQAAITSLDGATQHCALAAIGKATVQLTEDINETYALVKNASRAVSIHVGKYITAWNDTPGRTASEVAEAMRNAATS